MRNGLFTGTASIMKLLFRQQRTKILLWLTAFTVIILATALAYPDVYPNEQARTSFAMTMNNPLMEAMVGPGYETNEYLTTITTLFAQETLLFTAIIVAVMNILLIGRSTRADEEDGLMEYVQSLPVGRLTYLTAAMIVTITVNIMLAVLLGIGLYMTDVEGADLESSLLYGAVLGAAGLVFAAVTSLMAQLTETSRGTTMFSFAVLIAAYLVRAAGDVSNHTLSFFSSLGWTVRTDVFMSNNWWPVWVSLLTVIVIFSAAFYLNAIRDLGSGFIPQKPGRKHAPALLTTTFGFAWNQQRVNIISWMVILFIFSASFGYILDDLETYFADVPFMEQLLDKGSNLTQQFISILIAIMSLISAVPPVMTIMAIKNEETKDRVENFYSRAVSRIRLLGSYLLLAIFVSIMMQGLIGIGLWSASTAVMDQPLDFSNTIKSAFVYLAAIWCLLGLTVFLIGFIPKVSGFVWLYLAYGFIIVYLGDILDLPDWVNHMSVFEFVPELPAADMNMTHIFIMIGSACFLTVAGFLGYKKRDIRG
ncbi:ABC transporter permease [Virgibacillus ihumii]|uniref:ABC transporter permease n=1 Tax=Virgibacillus ihumii TaxID=2686091 RepID=UPI001FE6F0BE|nr:ABC-2 transporter permease [Virgibacillus ihumii]